MDNRLYLRQALNRSNVYDTDNKNINAELSAYEVGLIGFCDKLKNVLDNCFVETADSENIVKRVKLFRNYVITDDIEVLRAQLVEKAKIRSASMDDMKNRLKAVGIEGNISEEANKAVISANAYQGVSVETAEKEIKKYLPSYIEVIVT